ESLAIAEVELIGVRRLGVVVEEEDLWARGSRGDQRIETGLCEVLRLERDLREVDAVDRELQPVTLVERGVEEEAVVVASPAAEEDVLAVGAHVVGEAQARLPLVLVRLALAAGGEVARIDLAGQARHDGRGRDVGQVEHVRLVIPAQAELEAEVRVYGPTVLAEEAGLA